MARDPAGLNLPVLTASALPVKREHDSIRNTEIEVLMTVSMDLLAFLRRFFQIRNKCLPMVHVVTD